MKALGNMGRLVPGDVFTGILWSMRYFKFAFASASLFDKGLIDNQMHIQ